MTEPFDISSLMNSMTALTAPAGGVDNWKRIASAYWSQECNKLAAQVSLSIRARELSIRCEDFSASADVVLGGVASSSTRRVMDVWTYTVGERLFDDAPWRRYFECEARFVESGGIESIQSLLVVQDEAEISETRVRNLARFYKGHSAYACKWLPMKRYLVEQRRCGLDGAFVDFAIYGRDLVFQTTAYEPARGAFIGDTACVHKYTALFETLWSAAADVQALVGNDAPISLSELLQYDRHAAVGMP